MLPEQRAASEANLKRNLLGNLSYMEHQFTTKRHPFIQCVSDRVSIHAARGNRLRALGFA